MVIYHGTDDRLPHFGDLLLIHLFLVNRNQKMHSTILSIATIASLISVCASNEQYTFHAEDPIAPYVEDGTGRRFLTTGADCYLGGGRFQCDISTLVSASDGNTTTVEANLNCEFDSLVGVDFRRAKGCTCQGFVTQSDGIRRQCACSLCPAEYGDNPISIDCDYENRPEDVSPFVTDRCTSLDCDFNCNGTCNAGCVEPVDPNCYHLCGTVAPTDSPTPSTGHLVSAVIGAFAVSTLLLL